MRTLLACLLVVAVTCAHGKTLRFGADGTFKITQFTDLHYGESEDRDIKSGVVQGTVLAAEKPDLVVMTGDSVSGYAWDGKKGWFAERWGTLTSPMVQYNVSWAFALGNHDDEADLTRAEIVAYDQKYPLSLTQQGPNTIHGATNYYLFIYSSDETNEVPVAVLYILDSADTNCLNVTGWGCVYPDQIAWYKQVSASITQKYGKVIPALAFFHIPVPEFMTMFNGIDTYGRLEDVGVCCFSVNTGLFAAFKEMGDVISVHCGHDHDNDFFGIYDDIMLAYGRKTGYGGYGPPLGWERGARIIQLTESPFKMVHWIREQNGKIVQSSAQPLHHPSRNVSHCCGTVASPYSNCAAYAHQFAQHTL